MKLIAKLSEFWSSLNQWNNVVFWWVIYAVQFVRGTFVEFLLAKNSIFFIETVILFFLHLSDSLNFMFSLVNATWVWQLPYLFYLKDSFFTEKYFGYNRYIGHSLQEADLSLQAANFLSKNYLLIHGTADTLVHQQHTMLLTKSLIQKGVIYRHQVGWKWKKLSNQRNHKLLFSFTGLHWRRPWTQRRNLSRSQDNWIIYGR